MTSLYQMIVTDVLAPNMCQAISEHDEFTVPQHHMDHIT